MIRNRCALRKIPTMSLTLRSAAYQSNTFKKGCDDDDAATRTNPRVSPDMRKGSGKGKPQRPSRGKATPASVTALVSATRQGFLPFPKKHGPGHSVTLRQPRRPPTRATTVLQPSQRGLLTKTDETERRTQAEGSLDSSHAGGQNLHRHQEQTRPLWPGRARRAREAPMAALQSTRRRPSHPQQETLHQPPGAHREATPGPPKPRWGPKGPRSGPGQRCRWSLCRPATKRPRHRHHFTRRRRHPGGEQPPPEPCPPRGTAASTERPHVACLGRG
jgi:hypothetical protein